MKQFFRSMLISSLVMAPVMQAWDDPDLKMHKRCAWDSLKIATILGITTFALAKLESLCDSRASQALGCSASVYKTIASGSHFMSTLTSAGTILFGVAPLAFGLKLLLSKRSQGHVPSLFDAASKPQPK